MGEQMIQKIDSAATYCVGSFLTVFSCTATQLQPIIAVTGGFVGIVVCLAKGWYDWKKYRKEQSEK